MGDATGQDEAHNEELPQYVIGIVVISRVLFSGIATLGVVALIAPVVGLPALPLFEASTIVSLQWMVLFSIIGFIVIAAGFPLWMRLSWSIATPFSKTLRESAWDAIQDDKTYRERMKEMEREGSESEEN